MDHLVIRVPPYEGRYPFEAAALTTREWGFIKRLSGYLPLTITDGFSDPELITVFAAIALRRAGKIETNQVPEAFETLADAEFDGVAISYELDETEEDTAGPPPASSNGSASTSGDDSRTSTATPASSRPTPTGHPPSGSSGSALLTSAS